MTRRVITVLIAFLLAGLLCSTLSPARQADLSGEVARAVLRHEKLLTDARFEVPTGLYHYYLRDLRNPERPKFDSPIPYIAEEGTYHLTVKADSAAMLRAKVRLRVFDPQKCLNLPIFGTRNVIWKDLAADNEGAKLTITKGWVRFAATEPGLYTITGRFGSTGAIRLNVIRTVRTAVIFDSPGAWEVRAGGQVAGRFVGTAEKGTHGRLALKPTNKLSIEYTRPMPRRARPPRYSLQGDVAWNLGAAAQQVTASLKATISSGSSDRIVLLLPNGADRVKITGPEVRSVQVAGGRAVVHLRGKILGSTVLNVSFERPAGSGFGRFGVEGGRWTGGTLIVTNSAGGSEILPASMTGLRQMSLTEVPASARAILSAPAVLAYEITSRDFSAEVEVLRLGEFTLRESIADLAHYEVFLAGDGSVICRVRYEIRNSNKQFLRLRLPADAQVLLARVNEKSCPISPAPGLADQWLLPLERSRASVMGLVSFPVDVVFMCRTGELTYEGVAEIPLPAIDLPIAYAWCETYVPPGMEVKKWSGVLKKVVRFSSETATASLDYGWGEMAEGYSKDDRPTVKPKPDYGFIGGLFKPRAPRPEPTPQPTTTRPATQPGYVTSGEVEREMGVPILSRPSTVSRLVGGRSAIPILARNYYRTGKDYYDKNEFAESARYLEQVVKLAPGSTEASNARRLLANPQMPKARKLKGRAEKTAARGIEKRLAEQRRPMERRQEKLLAEALEATRTGKTAEAKAKLATVQVLHKKLIAQRADVYKQQSLMQQAQPGIKQLRKQTASKIAELRGEVSKLKKSGKYEEALKTASELRRHSGELTADYAYDKKDSRVAGLKRADREKLQKEMDELAAAASRERQRKGTKLNDVRWAKVPWHVLMNYPEDWPDVTARRKLKPAGIPTTTPARKDTGPVTRVYDIRDLVVRMPKFEGPNISLRTSGNNNNAAGLVWEDDDSDDDAEMSSRQKSTKDLLKLIRSTINRDTWGTGGGGGGAPDKSIRELDGRIIVTGSGENQQALADFLSQLRQARGPQVEEGEKIAQQRAAEPLTGARITAGDRVAGEDGGWRQWQGGKRVQIKDRELDEFIRRNYDWALQGRTHGDLKTTITVPDGGTLLLGGQLSSSGELISKLRFNLGQKVVVNSLNVNADVRTVAALGVRFNPGRNNVNWAVINEAQFRSLMELDAELSRRDGKAVAANERLQETIVGTDARLSNKMIANVSYAGDKGNVLNISGNTVNLAHKGYLLIAAGGHLTVVRAGAMQHWREKPTDVQFVEVPQNIEVPRVGQLFRFERTLLKPSDKMVIRAEYKQKGVSR